MKTYVEKLITKIVDGFEEVALEEEEDIEVLRSTNLGWAGSYSISKLEVLLERLKNAGATHIIIEQDEDHQEYTFTGTVIKEI